MKRVDLERGAQEGKSSREDQGTSLTLPSRTDKRRTDDGNESAKGPTESYWAWKAAHWRKQVSTIESMASCGGEDEEI